MVLFGSGSGGGRVRAMHESREQERNTLRGPTGLTIGVYRGMSLSGGRSAAAQHVR